MDDIAAALPGRTMGAVIRRRRDLGLSPRPCARFKWTQAEQELLRELWGEGLSARRISARMPYSRNAVIAQARRMELPPRKSPIRRMPKPKIVAPDFGVTDPTMKQCQWPYGDPKEPDFHYCGAPVHKHHPYCEAHLRIAWRPHALKGLAA